MVHWAPLHGMRHPPVWVQSMLQVAPGLQVVWQPPGMALQSTLQFVLAAQLVLQPPAGQAKAQFCPGVPQPSSQEAVTAGSALGVQVQLVPVQEQDALG
jgi:hypothetical protein